MITPQTNESSNFLILILMAILLKVLFDFKSKVGFIYPLLVKLLYMTIIISAVRQTKIEDYFKKYKI